MSTIPSDRSQTTPNDSTERIYPSGVPRHLRYPLAPAWSLLDRAAMAVPERTAIDFLGCRMSYRQVNDAAVDLAVWLQQHGLQPGERIGILLPNCPEYLIALNAIWRAGGVAVAISPLSVPNDVRRLLELTQCRTVVCLDLLAGLLPEQGVDHRLIVSLGRYLRRWQVPGYAAVRWLRNGRVRTVQGPNETALWSAVGQSNGQLIPVETLPASDPAYILSTGGTTADPKAVTLSHRNIVANAWQQLHWAGNSMGQESMLAVLPFFHSYGMSAMLASGCAMGATLLMQPRFQVKQVIDALERQRPTVFHAVPAMLAALNQRLRKQPADLSSLKWVISGGASLPVAAAIEFAAHSGAQVVEGYGLSEASPVTHVGPLDGSNRPGTIGLPLPDTECRIVDLETGERTVAPGEVGELTIRGPQVMLGYWSNPAATERTLRRGWLYTGDLARRTADGFYRIVDRKKDLIITSGFNVYPADVEQALRGCEDVADVAVIGVPDPERGELVKAFVVLQDGVSWNPDRLKRFAREHLAAHRRPRLWEHVLDDLPRNFLGKVIRRQLRSSTSHTGAVA